MANENNELLGLSAMVVAAYVQHNSVPRAELVGLIERTHGAMAALGREPMLEPAVEEKLVPAVPIRKSVTPDAIICLEDGKAFKSLKRHLRTKYNMSPEEYRTRWGLPRDYPMVAPAYAEARSAMAKLMGLGRKAVPVPAAGKAPRTKKTAAPPKG